MRRLRVESAEGTQTFPLPSRGELSLGSSQTNDITLDIEGVSRRHARLCLDGEAPRLVDLGSKNLLVFEGQRRSEVLLRPDVRVRIGLAFVSLDDAATSDAEIALPFDLESPGAPCRSATTESLIQQRQKAEKPASRSAELRPPSGMILGSSPALRELLGEIRASLRSRQDVLLEGETGTGKELFARLLHRSGPTARGPFIAINCAAIPGELLEAELFGVARRVATGVDPRPGRFEQAEGGTLLLDEVADLPLPLQSKLLRVLEEREILPLGALRGRKIEVRVISTANVRLADRVRSGAFRADLFYRLDRLRFEIPPLRERPEDIPPLTRAFAQSAARAQRRRIEGLTPRALRILLAHAWPGNIRELRSVVERAVLRCLGPVIDSTHLRDLAEEERSSPAASSSQAPQAAQPKPRSLKERLHAEEKRAVLEALEATGGHRSEAARRLGITRQSLFNMIKRHDLDPRSKKTP